MLFVAPAVRLKLLSPTMLKGGLLELVAVPVSVPPPVFWTVNIRSLVDPTVTSPKFSDDGVTLSAGGGEPVPLTERSTLPPLDVNPMVPFEVTAEVGLKRMVTLWLAPAPPANGLAGDWVLKGLAVEAVTVRV